MKTKFNVESNNNKLNIIQNTNGQFELSSLVFDKLKQIELDVNYLPFIKATIYLDNIIHSQNNDDKIIIGIDGMSNSFKTSFTTLISKLFNVNIFHTDNYFLIPPTTNLVYGNNINYEVIINKIITPLRTKSSEFKYPIYKDHKTTPHYLTCINYPVSILEGAYSLNSPLIEYIDYKILFETSPNKQRLRLENRESKISVETFLTKWIPLENQYLNHLKKTTKFDLIITT